MRDNPSVEIVRTIGSPFVRGSCESRDPTADIYENAQQNRVALMYLEALEREGRAKDFASELERYRERWRETLSVVANVSSVLNGVEHLDYVIFKSLKPYKATPNDTDILCLGDKNAYERSIAAIVKAGCLHLEDAPLQRTYYDPRGAGKVHSDKRGGVYYLDMYEKPGADYFVYLDTEKLRPHVTAAEVNGVTVPVLSPLVEMSTCLIHSVFPEKTYQLQDFYLTVNTLAHIAEEESEFFIEFVRDNHIKRAVAGSLTLTAAVHQAAFSMVPDVLTKVLSALGQDDRERTLFERTSCTTPYDFSIRLFAQTFFERLREKCSRASLALQVLHCLNPAFGFKAVERLIARCRPGGIYKAS